jgi:hypothetical protein
LPPDFIITHYQRLLNHIVPDTVHVMAQGRVVKSGGKELALEAKGLLAGDGGAGELEPLDLEELRQPGLGGGAEGGDQVHRPARGRARGRPAGRGARA